MDQVIFNWLVAFAGACGGWLLKIIWDAIQDLKKEVRTMDTKMHDDFVRRDDFKESIAEVKQDIIEVKRELKEDMRAGFHRLEDLIGALFKRVEQKADK